MTVVEFWVEQYQTVVAEKKALGDKLRETLDENKKLQQQIDDLKDSSLAYAALKNMETEKNDLQTRLNNSRASNEAYISMNSYLSRKLRSSMHQTQELKTQLEAEKKENESLHNVIDSFVDKCKELEAKVKGYENALKDGKERLDKSIADRSKLQADRDIWFNKDCEKQAEIEELKKKIQLLEADLKGETRSRDTWRAEAERLRKEITESYSDGYSDGNEEGQNELWEMLQLINDVKPFEAPYFEDVTSINDIISWDLEDFKEAYDKWEAEKNKAAEEAKKAHLEYMREYLKRYCIGRLCINCPLYDAFEPVSSCLFSKLTDEEVEKRYRKVTESERKVDLLKKVCGVKPKEEAHKLEYGDAVRLLPWIDYDYMYIGPDEKEETLVHLFDAENHAIVTTHISNVRYNGGRILVAEEDDIRKIWKYMK